MKMKQKKALIKLAQVRLAINHVLRQRMVKSAASRSFYGNTIHSNSNSESDGVVPYYEDIYYQDAMSDKYNYPYSVKPEYQYLRNIGDVEEGGNIHKMDVVSGGANGNTEIGIGVNRSAFKPMLNYWDKYGVTDGIDGIIPERPDIWDNPGINPYYWDELAFRASLPKTHPEYKSPKYVNKQVQNFYKRYNGNLPVRVETRSPINPRNGDTENLGLVSGLPFYPIEGVRYDFTPNEDEPSLKSDTTAADIIQKAQNPKYNGLLQPNTNK